MAAQLDAAAGESLAAGRSTSFDPVQLDDAPIQERRQQEATL